MARFSTLLSISTMALATAGGHSWAFAVTPPTALGASTNRAKLKTSSTPIKVEKRDDNVTQQKKTPLSEREKREKGGRGIMRSEIESMMVEKQLGKSLDREIAYSERLLPSINKRSEQRPEIMRRLIESYHQKALLIFFEESRRYETAWEAWDKKGRKGTEPRHDEKASKAWTSRVIQKAQQFITEYPNHKRVDEAYFQIAFAMDSMGQRQQGASYYSQIVKKFPNSKRMPDAHFALGEYHFDKQDYKKAISAFSETMRYPRSSVYPWAIYKIAWCHFNLQDYKRSLQSFKQTVHLSNTAQGMSAAGKIRLKEEALREMVNVFAELGNIDEAENYFESQGGEKHYGDLLIRLAGIMRERGQYQESTVILKKFVTKNPTDFKAAEIQIQIVDTLAKLSEKRLMWQEMKALLSNYRPETPWATKNAGNPELAEMNNRVHTVAITTTKQIHADYQKTNHRTFATEAETGYELYLTFYGARPEAQEVRFLLAELQYQQNKYNEAHKNFMLLTQQKEKNPYFAKAAEYGLSSSYFPIEVELQKLRKQPAKQSGTPIPISPALTNYIKTCEQFVTWFPTDKKVLDCHIDTAEIYLKHSHMAEAEKRLFQIAKTYPTRKEGVTSATMLLWFVEKDPAKLVARAEELSKIPQYNQGDLGQRMKKIKEAHRFELTMALEKGGQNQKAAQEFEKFAAENPTSADADKALYNAGVNYRKAGEIDRSIAAFTKLYTSYPKSTSVGNSIKNIIEMSETRLDIRQAAEHSYMFLQKFPKDKDVPVITRETCYLYDALNNIPKSIELCGKVVASRKQPDALDAARTLAELHFRNRRYTDFVSTIDTTLLKMPIKHNEKLDYLQRAVTVERKMGKITAANAHMAEIERLYRAKPKESAGKAITELAAVAFKKETPVFNSFRALKIESKKKDGSDLIPSVEKKNAALENVQKSFKNVTNIGDPEWTVASLYTMGYAFDLFAADLRNPAKPSWASDADMKVIRENFAKISAGPFEKAKALYAKAMEIAAKEAVDSEYVRKTADALTRMNPKEFKRLDEWVPSSTLFVGSQWLDARTTHKAIEALGGAQ
jgi:tetratricopeptide (TPR) repeat protein